MEDAGWIGMHGLDPWGLGMPPQPEPAGPTRATWEVGEWWERKGYLCWEEHLGQGGGCSLVRAAWEPLELWSFFLMRPHKSHGGILALTAQNNVWIQ